NDWASVSPCRRLPPAYTGSDRRNLLPLPTADPGYHGKPLPALRQIPLPADEKAGLPACQWDAFQSNPKLPDGVRFSSESSPHELIFYGTKLFRFLEGNQLQPLGSCRNTYFFSGQKSVPRPTVSTGITEIPIIR